MSDGSKITIRNLLEYVNDARQKQLQLIKMDSFKHYVNYYNLRSKIFTCQEHYKNPFLRYTRYDNKTVVKGNTVLNFFLNCSYPLQNSSLLQLYMISSIVSNCQSTFRIHSAESCLKQQHLFHGLKMLLLWMTLQCREEGAQSNILWSSRMFQDLD
jgi:hypothetical protein